MSGTAGYDTYLPEGLPRPEPEPDSLSEPFWSGLRERLLLVQRCRRCSTWQWPPEWICHACHAPDLAWTAVDGTGTVHSHTRAWHPVHPALKARGPYYIGIIQLDAAPVRLVGNLLFDAGASPVIGEPVTAVYEDHPHPTEPYTLLQWRRSDGSAETATVSTSAAPSR